MNCKLNEMKMMSFWLKKYKPQRAMYMHNPEMDVFTTQHIYESEFIQYGFKTLN